MALAYFTCPGRFCPSMLSLYNREGQRPTFIDIPEPKEQNTDVPSLSFALSWEPANKKDTSKYSIRVACTDEAEPGDIALVSDADEHITLVNVLEDGAAGSMHSQVRLVPRKIGMS